MDDWYSLGWGNLLRSVWPPLLPEPFGRGTRNNTEKRAYVLEHIGILEYRTLACATREEATSCERELKADKSAYIFPT